MKRIVHSVSLALVITASAGAQDAPLHLSFQHVTASVADLEKEAGWYERVLGFTRGATDGDAEHELVTHLTAPGVRIDLVKQKGSTRQHEATGPYEQGWLHIVFMVPDLQEAYRILQAKGTDVKANRNAKGEVQHLNLHDPEGNEIGFAQQ